MEVALYARAATHRQGSNRAELQIQAPRAHASERGFDVVEAYVCCDTGHSGTSLDRPGLNRFRYGVQAKAFDAVVIMSLDRLSRTSADLVRLLEALERCAVSVVLVEESGEAPLVHGRWVTAIRTHANQNDLPDREQDY